MTKSAPTQFRVADLATRKATRFSFSPEADVRKALAKALDIVEIRKLRLEGEIAPQGGRDWHLTAQLGATVVQPCVITLDPVVTRIEEAVTRTYLASFADSDVDEVEMSDDDTLEPIPAVLDLEAILMEALSLALPQFPRADGVELGEAFYAQDGATPMTDEDAKPFAGLGALFADKDTKDT